MPLLPDPIDWSDPDGPRSGRYGDRFAARAGALAQAQAVFLHGNGLPARWRHRSHFVILETGFGLGNNFLATWDAWKRDPQRPTRLFFLSLDAHPASHQDLARAHAHSPLAGAAATLQARWPPRVAGWHRLDFEDGAVQLLLAWGDVLDVLPQWQAEVDAFYLDGFAPRLNPAMWSERALAPLGRLAAVGATAATWSAARPVRDALQAAGFRCERAPGFGGKNDMTVARFAPHHRAGAPAGRRPLAAHAQEAVVVGAGIAGAACARALREAGLAVTVVEGGSSPAQGASGNPAGLFHASVHADDGPHARWSRAAALRTRQWLRRWPPPWVIDGLLRLSPGQDAGSRTAMAQRLGFGADFTRSLDSAQASQLAGIETEHGGWFFPGGGALPPRQWVHALLHGVPLHTDVQVDALQALPHGRWALLDAHGHCVAETGLLVLAAGHALPRLLAPLDPALAAQLRAQRGQVSQWNTLPGPHPRLPVADGGYVLALPPGGLLAGATATPNDTDLPDADFTPRADDDAHNHAVAERLLGQALPPPDAARVGQRLLTPDRLPLVGGLVDSAIASPSRATQAAHWPRRPGLLLCGAMASRGLSWAPLAAEVLAAQALGWPAPVPRALIDAVDPARFAARAARYSGGP